MPSTLLALLRDAASGGITVCRTAFHLGHATVQVVVKIVFAK